MFFATPISLGKLFYWPRGPKPDFGPLKIWSKNKLFQIWSYYISLDLFFHADYEKHNENG